MIWTVQKQLPVSVTSHYHNIILGNVIYWGGSHVRFVRFCLFFVCVHFEKVQEADMKIGTKTDKNRQKYYAIFKQF